MVEAGKDITYTIVIIVGLALCTVFGYSALSELFSKHSPSTVYSKTAALVVEDDRITKTIGNNIRVSASVNEHRERIPSHVEYEVNGYVNTCI